MILLSAFVQTTERPEAALLELAFRLAAACFTVGLEVVTLCPPTDERKATQQNSVVSHAAIWRITKKAKPVRASLFVLIDRNLLT